MCTGWCPLAAEWGNWAEWAAALAAAVVGYYVWRVSVETNKLAAKTNALAEAGNETNAALARLEEKRETDGAQLRERERILILVSLARVIGQTYVALSTLETLLADPKMAARVADLHEATVIVINTLEDGRFEIPESTRARMHFLDLQTAAKILRIEGAVPLFRNMVKTIPGSKPEAAKQTVQTLIAGLPIATREALDIYNQCQAANRSAGLEVSDLPTGG